MSAQVISALRARATMLDAEAANLEAMGVHEDPASYGQERTTGNLRFMAAEMRAVAGIAEAVS